MNNDIQEIIQKNTSITSFRMPDKLEVVMEKYLYDSVVEELNIKYPDKLYETSYKIVSDVLYEIIPVNESNARLIIKNYCEFYANVCKLLCSNIYNFITDYLESLHNLFVYLNMMALLNNADEEIKREKVDKSVKTFDEDEKTDDDKKNKRRKEKKEMKIERKEREKLELEKLELKKLELERLKQEKLELEKLEKLEKIRLEQEKLKLEKNRLEKDRLELKKIRLDEEKLKKDRLNRLLENSENTKLNNPTTNNKDTRREEEIDRLQQIERSQQIKTPEYEAIKDKKNEKLNNISTKSTSNSLVVYNEEIEYYDKYENLDDFFNHLPKKNKKYLIPLFFEENESVGDYEKMVSYLNENENLKNQCLFIFNANEKNLEGSNEVWTGTAKIANLINYDSGLIAGIMTGTQDKIMRKNLVFDIKNPARNNGFQSLSDIITEIKLNELNELNKNNMLKLQISNPNYVQVKTLLDLSFNIIESKIENKNYIFYSASKTYNSAYRIFNIRSYQSNLGDGVRDYISEKFVDLMKKNEITYLYPSQL
jgi:hypothetical protein